MELKVQKRTILGKKIKSLRTKGIIPGEVFGHGKENMHVSVSEKEFTKLYRNAGAHTIFTLDVEGGEKVPALVSYIARNTLSQKIITVDFHQVRMDEVIQTDVPIEFIGDAPATKLGLAILKIHNKLPIEALPANIPHKITVDISKLTDVGMSINIGELSISKGVEVLLSKDTVLVTVSEKAKEEAPAPTPVAEDAAATEEKEKEVPEEKTDQKPTGENKK